VRSFNYRYSCNVLIEPEMKVTEFPKVLGLDGQQKMSKSLNNHIELAATPAETQRLVLTMVTDPQRMRRSDPGNPDVCNVFSLHKVFSSSQEVEMVNVECRRAGIGCVDCKKLLSKNLNAHLEPFRARRAEIGAHPEQVWDVLHDGARRAREIAEDTMVAVRDAVGLPKKA
jgi:tryptophanyl-tRNA synthetase